ncbi:efflux RND transporter periplasmic adaptor subunit [Paenibacillus sp. LHD-117]|uniref:efflux RND transporter periplasmic adaptor subunit n=1 Tax=Paenibacillus sp. LHD-117 TaxID=3071412 RepID=UPI0027E0FDE4|nr:efflux RND transporter periplasmic adaptor subunit [Paenibacillus sp. LHD-117]MDQ6421222.1 efflux RND transporter periplasmic adaptor subunit [Paenibacillus sp. LHD-117]
MFRTKRMKRIAGLTAALAAALSLTGCSLLPAEEEPLKPPLVKPPQENYRTVEVVKGRITQEIRGNGTLESYFTDTVQFKAGGGIVKEVLVKAGDIVKKGDPLIRLDTGNMDIELKQMELNLARSSQALKSAKLGGDSEGIKIAQLQYDIDKLKHERLSEALEGKLLVAETDGQVTYVAELKEGDPVREFETLAVVADPSKLRVAFQTDGTPDVNLVSVGFKAELTFEGKTELTGKVIQTPSSAPFTEDEIARERNAKMIFVELEKLPEGAKIGTRADVKVLLQERNDVIIIPRSGLRSYLGRTFVRILEEGDKIREIDVETGIKGSTDIEITKGLEEGMLIVLP